MSHLSSATNRNRAGRVFSVGTVVGVECARPPILFRRESRLHVRAEHRTARSRPGLGLVNAGNMALEASRTREVEASRDVSATRGGYDPSHLRGPPRSPQASEAFSATRLDAQHTLFEDDEDSSTEAADGGVSEEGRSEGDGSTFPPSQVVPSPRRRSQVGALTADDGVPQDEAEPGRSLRLQEKHGRPDDDVSGLPRTSRYDHTSEGANGSPAAQAEDEQTQASL